jgi:sRNA-binding carbon storage regulator CsrA
VLTLNRKVFEAVQLRDTETGRVITVEVGRIARGHVWLRFTADRAVEILRSELVGVTPTEGGNDAK